MENKQIFRLGDWKEGQSGVHSWDYKLAGSRISITYDAPITSEIIDAAHGYLENLRKHFKLDQPGGE